MKSVLVALIVCWGTVAFGEPVVTIRNNGPNEIRLNIIVLSDGYTAGEMLKFATDVDLLILGFFDQKPFSSYREYFNVHRIDVVSNESGADHPDLGVVRDTALGARFNCINVANALCVDTEKVTAVLNRSVPVAIRHLVMVLVNDRRTGGFGGMYAVGSVGSTNQRMVETLLHETGHTLGLLADEYAYNTGVSGVDGVCNPNAVAVNSTRESTRESVKWNYWIDDTTAVPTTGPLFGVVGLWVGSTYCVEGLYRSSWNSKMRTTGVAFYQVNTEQLIRRIYNFVSPIDFVQPAVGAITMTRPEAIQFVVQRPKDLPTQWWVDGQSVSTDFALSLDSTTLSDGMHSVEVEVRDTTPDVRRDTASALVERARWTITVAP
jgi:hypothetical protein